MTYFNVFARLTRAGDAHLLEDQPMNDSDIGLPAIATFSRFIDTIRKDTDGKWRVEQRVVDETMNNSAFKTL